MATKLDKDVVRESTSKINDREIMVTLSERQEITLKLKGMKSGEKSISITALFNYLNGTIEVVNEEPVVEKKGKLLSISSEVEDKPSAGPLINLEELRSINNISMLDVPTMAKFDGIISELIKQKKEVAASLNKSKKKN